MCILRNVLVFLFFAVDSDFQCSSPHFFDPRNAC